MFRAAGADSAYLAFQPPSFKNSIPISDRVVACRLARARHAPWATGLLLCCLSAPLVVFAQSPTPAQDKPASAAETPKPSPAAQPLPRVTTTVVVHGEMPGE